MKRVAAADFVVVLVVVSLLAASPASAASQRVIGSPDISVSSPDGTLETQTAQPLTVVLTNNGDIQAGGNSAYEDEVRAAQDVQVRVLENRIDAPITVRTGTLSLGSIPNGGSARPQFEIEVGDAEPGTYRIPVQVRYDHAQSIAYGPGEETERTTDEDEHVEYVTVRVEDRPRFAVDAAGDNAVVAGDTGDLAVTLSNTGTREATDARVSLTANSPGIFFGTADNPSQSISVRVSSLGVGETTNVSVSTGARGDVSPGSYPVVARVAYENANGVTERSNALQTGLVVRPEQSFSLEDVTTTAFRVDESEARIRAQVVNDGPAHARQVVVGLDDAAPFTVTSGEAAVGDLAPGESAPVSFTVQIPADVEPGSNSLGFGVEYENADGDVRRLSAPIRQSVEVGAERDRFRVVDVATSVTPGGSDELAVDLRYVGDEPATHASAKLFASDPLSSSDDGAYLGTIDPNETVTATFQVSASGDALNKSYGSSVEVTYDEPDGDTRYSGSLSLGVAVGESSGGLPLLPLAAVGIALAGGAAVVYTRD